LPKEPRLIIELASTNQPINFLKTHKIGLLMIDAINDSLQGVSSIPPADAFMDIP
jgi:hypothetical protein